MGTMGLRASTAGQLGGGVSVCLRSLVDFGWGNSWTEVSMEIGKRHGPPPPDSIFGNFSGDADGEGRGLDRIGG